ncbi:MAG: RICIN domain-containing protein [Eggerthellaceae bacterium]|nr:RICIN domain-containing protein [Eggerthellaceae bacterium]
MIVVLAAAVLLCVPFTSWAVSDGSGSGLTTATIETPEDQAKITPAPVFAFTKQQVNMKMKSVGGQVIPDGSYIISSSSNAQMLVGVPNKKNGSAVKLAKQSNSKLKVWTFTYIKSSDSYEIRNVGSKLVLTLNGSNIVERKAISRGGSGYQKQRWLVTATSTGYTIQSLANKKVYLTVSGSKIKGLSKKTGKKASSQKFWLFNAKNWTTSNVVKSGAYVIKSAAGNVFVQPLGNKVTDGARSVVEAKKNKNRAQIYNIQLHKKGLYKIVNVGTTRALTASTTSDKVIEQKFTGAYAQLWKATLDDDGSVQFRNKKTGKVLDIAGGQAAAGRFLKQAVAAEDVDTQKWKLSPTITGLNTMQAKALQRVSNMKSATDYSIAIDLTRHYLMLFKHDKEADTAWQLDDSWRVSNGMNKATVEWVGTKYRFYETNPEYKGYSAYYWSGMGHAQYMHSIIYYPGTHNVQDGALGRSNSSGCVRMSLSNAKYIYYEVPNGTRVQRYY